MRNTVPENDAEHSLQVAMIAHAIAIIARDRYGKDVDPEHVLSLAVYQRMLIRSMYCPWRFIMMRQK